MKGPNNSPGDQSRRTLRGDSGISSRELPETDMKVCKYYLCNDEVIGRADKQYCSRRCVNRDKVRRWRQRVKERAVAYKGGSCERCGYDRCVAALTFHHRDPTTKSFGIAEKGVTRSWKRVKEELDKCDLLCANCHAEVEHIVLGSVLVRTGDC